MNLDKLQELLLGGKRINLSERQVCDLELILNGGFSPLEGFLNESDYLSVLSSMRLSDGSVWPVPVVLDVFDGDGYEVGEHVVLCDKFGNPLAIMNVESRYKPDKLLEAERVYGTTDETHFGVKYLFQNTGDIYLGGKVFSVSDIENEHTPESLKKWFSEKGWNKVVAFQTRNPIHKAHFELIKRVAKDNDAKILIHPAVGQTKDGDIESYTRIKIYEHVTNEYASDFAKLSLLPLAMRMAGPREALWHALIRKNYGCTHFIVGRDHAGPGKDKDGNDFYGKYDAQELAKKYEDEIGIKIIPVEEMAYVEETGKYHFLREIENDNTVKNISGTQFREMLKNGEEIPEWFSFTGVVDILKKEEDKKKSGFVIFFTGLSGAGKSTIAQILYERLTEMQDRRITLLDGDVVRQNLSKGLGFSKEDRNTNVERVGFVASEIAKYGGIAICSMIAPYEESRKKNRDLIEKNGNYIEIFISTPLEICEGRDSKGLYKKARSGELRGFTGIDDPYEKPQDPEVSINTEKLTEKESVENILTYLKSLNLI